MKQTHLIDGSAGKVAVHTWAHEDPRFVVLLAHGYGEHAGRYQHVAEVLAAAGATVVAPDHRGHGESDGERALVTDVEQVVDDFAAARAAAAPDGLPVVVLGHSMGGIVATRYVQRSPQDVVGLVMTGPVIGGNPLFEMLAGMDPIPDVPIDPAMLSRDPAVGAAYAADPLVYHGPFLKPTLDAMFAAVAAIAEGPGFGDLPTLWLHGEADQLAPYDATAGAMANLRGPATAEKVYPGAAHEILNETNKDEVLADVVAFVAGIAPA